MSAASKGKALCPWKVREQVARELAKVIIASPHGVRAHSTRTGCFDVHAAREHASSLRLYGRHYALTCPVVRNFAEACPGARWTGLDGHDLAYTRLGQHILDAIEGQPSSCQACEGNPPWYGSGPSSKQRCDACNQSGHNLRGYLPEPEVSPQLRRRIADGWALSEGELWDGEPNWLHDLALEHGVSSRRTRVTPRGEHREVDPDDPIAMAQDLYEHATQDPHGFHTASRTPPPHDAHIRAYYLRRLPRWRRGELKHAQQRREREARP